MPPRTKKSDPTEDAVEMGDSPHADCLPAGGLPAGATSFACEHGSWTFEPVPAGDPAPVDVDQVLAGVDIETLRAALAARETATPPAQ